MSDVDAQYERIVRMIPVDALQSSYNSVIQDGISSVNNAVDSAVAALSHVKEVRGAVDKLGQDKTQKNKNLLNSMDKTMALQRKLELVLQKMIQVEHARNFNKKQKNSADSGIGGVSKGDSNSECIAGKPIATRGRSELTKRKGEVQDEDQKRIRLSTRNATSAGTPRILNLLPPVEKKETPLRPVEIINCFEENAMTDNLRTSEDYLQMMRKLAKVSAIDRYAHIREVLEEVADVVDKYGRTRVQEEHAVIFVKTVNLWPLRDNTDQKSLMDVYQRFLKAMEAYKNQMVDTKDRDQLKWSLDILSWVLKGLESRVSKGQLKGPATGTHSQPAVFKATKPLQQHTAIYTTIFKNAEQIPMRSRLKTIPRILLLLKDAIVTDEAGAQKTAIADSIEELLKWMRKGCEVWQDLEAKEVADQFSKTIDKIRLGSSGEKIFQADDRQGKDNVEPTTPISGAIEGTNRKRMNANDNGGKQRDSDRSQRLELTRGNCLEKLRMMTQVSVAERRQQLPGVLAKLSDIVVVSKKQEQLSILKYVLLWAKLSAGNGDNMRAYDRFCKDMTAMISRRPESGRKAGLERLNNSLFAVLKEHRPKTETLLSISYDLMVFRVNVMSPSERVKHIPEVFMSLKNEMARGAGATNLHEILDALRAVKQWANDLPEESTVRQLYGDLAGQIELYNHGVSMFYAKVSLTSEIHNFREISGIPFPENDETAADRVLAKVKLLSGTSEAHRQLQIDECICMLGNVLLQTCERKWPAAAVESYKLLLKYLEPYSSQFRNQRIGALNKWMYRHVPGLR